MREAPACPQAARLAKQTPEADWIFRRSSWEMARNAYDPSSATRPARRNDCNREVMAGFAAAHG